jgi:hypothetical protein
MIRLDTEIVMDMDMHWIRGGIALALSCEISWNGLYGGSSIRNGETKFHGVSRHFYYMTMYILCLSHTIALYPTPEKRLIISKGKLSPIIGGQPIIMVVGLPD